jgi:hypothetical protein
MHCWVAVGFFVTVLRRPLVAALRHAWPGPVSQLTARQASWADQVALTGSVNFAEKNPVLLAVAVTIQYHSLLPLGLRMIKTRCR